MLSSDERWASAIHVYCVDPFCYNYHYCMFATNRTQPVYLNSQLIPAKQPRQLPSSNSNLLFVPSVKTNVGTRAFSVAAPTLWSSLPVNVKSVELTPC